MKKKESVVIDIRFKNFLVNINIKIKLINR